MKSDKPHIAILSSPGLGHLIPSIELAKRFVVDHNIKVTILSVTSQTSEAEAQVLKSATNPKLYDMVEIPPAEVSAGYADNSIVTRLCVMIREILPSLRSVLSNMSLRPSVLIVDIFGTEALSIAEEFNMRN